MERGKFAEHHYAVAAPHLDAEMGHLDIAAPRRNVAAPHLDAEMTCRNVAATCCNSATGRCKPAMPHLDIKINVCSV